MKKILVIILLFLGTGCNVWTEQMLSEVNNYRNRNGVASVKVCNNLSDAAQRHSADQARMRKASHIGSNGSTVLQRNRSYRSGRLGENVASGYSNVSSVMQAWIASPAHRQTMLRPYFVHVGFGRAVGANGVLYWTQNFAGGGVCK